MKLVTFIKSSAPYNAGEGAGFSDEQANILVSSGLAIFVSEEKETVPAEENTKLVRKTKEEK